MSSKTRSLLGVEQECVASAVSVAFDVPGSHELDGGQILRERELNVWIRW